MENSKPLLLTARQPAGVYQRLLMAFCFIFAVTGVLPVSAQTAVVPQNFHQVSADLWRSAQPDAAQMQTLEQRGIKTILNLRQWHDDDGEAAGTHLNLRRVPMNAAAFNNLDVVSALREIHLAPKPVLVHCWHGSDRTGLIVAMYRLVFENASRSEVLAELRTPAYGYHENHYPGIARYLSTVDIPQIQQAVFSQQPLAQ